MPCDPLFSFVIPAYNVERYISKTLGSLLSQTDKDFEIIVVDDGSTDNTYNVAKEILEKSGFSNYTILRKPNGGVSSARNMGIKHAIGSIIIILVSHNPELTRGAYYFLTFQLPLIPEILYSMGITSRERLLIRYTFTLYFLTQYLYGLFYIPVETGEFVFIPYRNVLLK
ncbi:MAG: glycosyltransferase family A protein [Desulfurococcaceae archaeon]